MVCNEKYFGNLLVWKNKNCLYNNLNYRQNKLYGNNSFEIHRFAKNTTLLRKRVLKGEKYDFIQTAFEYNCILLFLVKPLLQFSLILFLIKINLVWKNYICQLRKKDFVFQ